MNQKSTNIFYARNLSELFYQLKTIANLKIVGSCTAISELPEKIISTTLIREFNHIEKHERYIEFGPATTLAEIQALGERHLPKILLDAIGTIANPFVRNIATIGGNIMDPEQKNTLYAPLMAMDTILEFKSPSESKYITIQNYSKIPENHVLTNIRVPLNEWDICIFKRLGPSHTITENSASFAFLVDSEKGIITNLRIAYSGKITFRCISLENHMLGLRLPLKSKEIPNYLDEAENEFNSAAKQAKFNPVLKQQFLNLVRYSFDQLT
ncbi:MAG: FAD binding domain-containing protein [Treponema sp.]|nr:FAD binding domain-containing protein [Treponema sp.]